LDVLLDLVQCATIASRLKRPYVFAKYALVVRFLVVWYPLKGVKDNKPFIGHLGAYAKLGCTASLKTASFYDAALTGRENRL